LKKRTGTILIAFVLIVFLFVAPVRNFVSEKLSSSVVYPERVLTVTGERTRNFFSFFFTIRNLRDQNNILAEKLVNLEVDKSQMNELEHENQLLKGELGFLDKNQDTTLLSAKIIGRDPDTFLDHIIVDRGSDDGVKVGQAVVSGNVLVGQVKDVSGNHSEVTLITSKDSLILAMLQDSRANGLLRGGIAGLVLENISQDTKYSVGENIVTSGLGGELKPGILIGTTSAIQSTSSDLYKNITIEPLVDLSKLELVFIMR
jgi:rod shape-determining protein MreC